MNVTVNGRQETLESGATIEHALAVAGHEGGHFGVAVAVNGEVVARARWARTDLAEGDRVEVLVAAQGG